MPEQELELNETPNAGKKSKKLFIFGGIGLVLVLLIGGGLWFFMGSDEPAATDVSADASADPAAPIVSSEAEYVGMPRPFLFNLPGADRARLVEIKVQLMVRGESNSVLTQKHIPLIEDALLTLRFWLLIASVPVPCIMSLNAPMSMGTATAGDPTVVVSSRVSTKVFATSIIEAFVCVTTAPIL